MKSFVDRLESHENSADFLYHYTSMEKCFEHILPGHNLRPSPFLKMSDPLESTLFSIAYPEPDFKKIEATFEELNRLRAATKFISFCTDARPAERKPYPYNKGYAKSRMWCQYAKQHQGVCLVFSKEKLMDVTPLVMHKSKKKEIDYRNDVSKKLNRLLQKELLHAVDAQTFFQDHSDLLLFTKTTDYRDESEFRITFRTDKEFSHIPYENALVGVVVGWNFNSCYDSLLVHYIKNHRVPFAKIHWWLGNPSLSPYPYSEIPSPIKPTESNS